MAVVASETRQTLSGLAAGHIEVLEKAVGLRELNRAGSGLDARTYWLVKLATLIALDAPRASYAWQIANAIDEGATPMDFLGVLGAVAPQVGGPRVIAAAAELMVAMGPETGVLAPADGAYDARATSRRRPKGQAGVARGSGTNFDVA